jgi:hypothetical protein
MSYSKFIILILISVSIVVVRAEEVKCDNPEECYKKAVDKMVFDLKADRAELRQFLRTESEYLEKKSNEIDKSSKQIEVETEAVNKKAAELSKKSLELDLVSADITKKHLEIDLRHEEFKKEIALLGETSSEAIKLKNNHLYRDAIIYHNIFDAFTKGICKKVGSPVGWNDELYAKREWNGRLILRLGFIDNSENNGMQVKVPDDYDVLWLRILNDRFFRVSVSYEDNGRKNIGQYAGGFRKLNEITPEGATPDSSSILHMWLPIPVKMGKVHIIRSNQGSDSWISGIAFGKNLWGHAMNSAIAYHYAANGGNTLEWESHNWNNDQLGKIAFGGVRKLMVPVVGNGKDKLFYIVEHNNNWLGTMHTSVKVNGTFVERLRTTYSNPFATHFNSKFYDRYMSCFIPKELIPEGATFITVDIDMSKQDKNIFFREAGTHDFE